jgi:elongator complex protein 2
VVLSARLVSETLYRINEEENENCPCNVRLISGRNAALPDDISTAKNHSGHHHASGVGAAVANQSKSWTQFSRLTRACTFDGTDAMNAQDVSVGYLAAGANRQTAVADWSRGGLLAFGADSNIALWRPTVSLIAMVAVPYKSIC